MGSRQPPQLQTMKMKKTTVWATRRLSRLVSSSGRISSMAAPVVPTRLASTAPTARKMALVRGRAGRSPAMRMPPLIVYRLNSSRMKGTYSPKTARVSRPRPSPDWARRRPAACAAGRAIRLPGESAAEEVIGRS